MYMNYAPCSCTMNYAHAPCTMHYVLCTMYPSRVALVHGVFYYVSEPVELFVISTRDGNKFGQFVFPKNVLLHRTIVSNKGEGGKRGMRVYPSWDKATSLQAQKT
ncbi:hypothetical protein GCM10008018_62650 [Paenibacillus marchantiophytorum]|uniref:Uncharacterized protein n=1 Tax=Paenibacillus marchantiophytorum TaxID=1619310 RepID=A0ABQ1FFM0_9BACL|nr:MepB family protein [Paenibacillus marchantiophytorum]GGA08492.1 hypothetical protein GCM10008018_62650 [Paenibacillus marchantiophytorum]